ncbi:MAG: RelA/SpoT domain-containing protein [Acidovorax sp.]
MTDAELLAEYARRHEVALKPLAEGLARHLTDRLAGVKRIDRVSARAKDPERFLAKATKEADGRRKYGDPFSQIQDQVAARVTVFYLSDVEAVEATLRKYFNRIEEITVAEEPKKFGYEGRHLILAIPEELFEEEEHPDAPDFFELQIKTLFQHAWSEAEHDLAYKPPTPLTDGQTREIAFTAAQAWGADQMFAKLFKELGENR